MAAVLDRRLVQHSLMYHQHLTVLAWSLCRHAPLVSYSSNTACKPQRPPRYRRIDQCMIRYIIAGVPGGERVLP
jgi:hypothetical protein